MVFEDADHRNNNSIRQQLEDLFDRDWNSQYAQPLNASCSSLRAPKGFFARAQIIPPLQLHHVHA